MRILFSDNSLSCLLNFRGPVIEHCISLGYEVVLVAPQDGKCDLLKIPQSVRYIPIVLDRTGINPWKDLKYFMQLFRIYRSERPDYIFHYTIKANIYGSLVTGILRIKSSAMVAGLGYVFSRNTLSNRIARLLYKIALHFSDKVFVLNQSNRDTLLKYNIANEKKLTWLKGGEGVDLQRFGQLPYPANSRIRFLLIARLLYEKGYTEYVEAAKALKSRCDFCIMGALDSNPTAVPADVVERDVQAGYIKHILFNPDVRTEIAASDCIVLPSFYFEGLSRVLMEALASGRPIICSDIPGCRETVIDGENGFLCQPKDALSLTDACRRFLALPYEERLRMGQKSRALAEQTFDVTKVISEYDILLYKLNNYDFISHE